MHRMLIRFEGPSNVYDEFENRLPSVNAIVSAKVEIHKPISKDVSQRLTRLYNFMVVHYDDVHEYYESEHQSELIRLFEEDVANYGELMIKTYPQLLK